jgi:hypothetical protein
MRPLAPALLALLLVLPLYAQQAPPIQEVTIEGRVAGWAVDSAHVLAIKDKAAREKEIEAIVQYVVEERNYTEVDKKWQVDCLAAYLQDVLRYDSSHITATQIFFDREWKLILRQFTSAGIRESVAKFEPTETGWPHAEKDKPGIGLSIYTRNVNSLGAQTAYIKPFQYLGHWGLEVLTRKTETNTDSWYWPLVGAKTWETPIVKRLYRDPEGRISIDKGHQVTKESKTLYDSWPILGAAPAAVASAVGLSKEWKPACSGIDLTTQFPDVLSRDQCSVGSCHIFATLAPVEAALNRAYDLKVRLSEADLFVQVKVKSKDLYSGASDEAGGAVRLSEGGYPAENLEYALAHGIATDKSAPYDRMLGKYEGWRESQQKSIAAAKKSETILNNTKGHWGEMETEDFAKKNNERFLLGAADLQAERDAVKKALTGFKVEKNSFGYFDSGVTQKQKLVDYLCRGIPVAVSMELAGLPEWGQSKNSEHARHAFIIKGFERADDKFIFKTRNSWGPFHSTRATSNPDIPEEQLSRIYAADALLTASEAKAKGAPAAEVKKELAAFAAK